MLLLVFFFFFFPFSVNGNGKDNFSHDDNLVTKIIVSAASDYSILDFIFSFHGLALGLLHVSNLVHLDL